MTGTDHHIAEFNYGRMRWPLDDARMQEFADDLERVYGLAAAADGFAWRIGDEDMAEGLARHGYDALTSATVSVWRDVDSLKAFTYKGAHGHYLDRTLEWFEVIDPPQVVIWPVEQGHQPSVDEALERLVDLKENGPSERAFGLGAPGVGG